MKHGLVALSRDCPPYDQEQLKGITVGKEPWVALLPAEHPLVRQDPDARNITLRQIANEPLIIPHRKYRETAIRNWFAGIGEEPNIICELSDYLDAVALVEQGVGIAIFPHTTYTPNLLAATRIITEPAKYAQYEVVWRRNDSMPALTHEFINYIRDFLQEDLIHTAEIYRVYGTEFEVPEGAKLL